MYSNQQPRQPFYGGRQPNIRQQRPFMNSGTSVQSGQGIYQNPHSLTTMFMPPQGIRQNSVIQVTPGNQQIAGSPYQYQAVHHPQYTINTNQPAHYAVTQNYAVAAPGYQASTEMYPKNIYYVQNPSTVTPAAANMQMPAQPQQQPHMNVAATPQVTPQTQMPQQQTQVLQQVPTSAPPSQPLQSSRSFSAKNRKRTPLEIIDPVTGKNVMADMKKTPPSSEQTSSRGTPLGSTPPPGAQGGTGTEIAAQFAAQVAATLGKQKPDQGTPQSSIPVHQHTIQQRPVHHPTGSKPGYSSYQGPPSAQAAPILSHSNVTVPPISQADSGPSQPEAAKMALPQEMPQAHTANHGIASVQQSVSGVYSKQSIPTVAQNVAIAPAQVPLAPDTSQLPDVQQESEVATLPTTIQEKPQKPFSQPSLPVNISGSTTESQVQIEKQSDRVDENLPHQQDLSDNNVAVIAAALGSSEASVTVSVEENQQIQKSEVNVENDNDQSSQKASVLSSNQTQEVKFNKTEMTVDENNPIKTTTECVQENTMNSSDQAAINSSVCATEIKVDIAEQDTASCAVDVNEVSERVQADLDKKKNPRQRLKDSEEKDCAAKINAAEIINNNKESAGAPVHEEADVNIQPIKSKDDEIDAVPAFVVEPLSQVDSAANERKAEAGDHVVSSKTSSIEKEVVYDNDEESKEDVDNANKVALENAKNVEEKEKMEVNDEMKPKKQLELKYDYKEDQWSPINLEGKRAYDRNFLLNMQFASMSVTKPVGLPDLPELILDQPNTITRPGAPGGNHFNRPDMGGVDFTPGFVRGVVGPRGAQIPKRNSREQRGGREPRKVISINREPEIQLTKSDNPYKVGFKQKKDATGESKNEELYRKLRSILNKLTPQKFQTLIQQILALEINSEERLTECINIIFEKAIDEPAFSVAYANACKIMSAHVHVTSAKNPNEKVTFKKLLLNRCQTEFEKDQLEASEMEKMKEKIAAAENEEQKKLLQEEMDFTEAKAKRRSLGNIRFIGELFKLNMLTERIMHDCIMNLLKSTDEESLECLCRLVSTIGKGLDHEKAKPLMDQYFQKIEKIIRSKVTSARTRFMLQDLQDLRKNNWTPRREENAPKTIAEIHKEAAEEKIEKAVLHQRLAQESRSMPRPAGTPRGSRGGMPPQTDEQGWQSVPSNRTNRIDPSKMKLSKTNVDDNITLGPGARFGGWGRGSTGGGKNVSQEGEKPPGNRFSALSGGAGVTSGSPSLDSDARRSGAGINRGGRDPRGRLSTARGGRGYTRGSQEKEAAIQAARNISATRAEADRLTPGSSRNQSRESSSSRDTRQTETPSPVPTTKDESKEEMDSSTIERKAKSTIDEYLSIHDLKEAIECAKEIPAHSMHIFADKAIQHVLERSDVARRMTGTLLHDLVKNSVLSVDQYLQGLKETLEYAEDMEIDIPKIWEYLGELIGPMVQDGSVPLNFLKTACEPLQSNNKAGLLVAQVLCDAAQRLGHLKVGEQWKSAGLSWSQFMKEEEVDEFIKKHKLEYTIDSEEPLSPVGKGLSNEQIQAQLDDLIQTKDKENEDIFDWVVINVGESNTKKPSFVRALMTSVCSSAIKGSVDKAKVDTLVIKRRGNLLQKYMDHDAVLELQALFALQALVHKLQHPPDVLRMLFDILYDEDLISEDAFNQWDQSDDPAEQTGKGVAKSSVVQFFRWLREAEEETDEVQ